MRTAPTNWAELMAQPHQTETRVDIGGVSYYGYDGESGIWSLTTHNALFENFGAGNCHSGTIDLTLVNPQSIPTMAKMEVYVRLSSNVQDTQLFACSRGTTSTASTVVQYSNSIVEQDGSYALAEPIQTVSISYNNYNNARFLAGKYWERYDGVLCFSPQNATVTRETSTSSFGIKTYYAEISARRVADTYTAWVRKGVYFIDTREWDARHEFLTITGFDAMLKAEQPYIVSDATDPVILDEFTIPQGRMRGDVNGNGVIDRGNVPYEEGGRSDNQITYAASVGEVELDTTEKWCADVDDDGEITSSDVLFISQRAGGDYNAYTNADYYGNWTWRDDTHDWFVFAAKTVPNGAVLILPDGFTYEEATGGINIICANPPLTEKTAQIAIFGWPRLDNLVALEVAMRLGVELDTRTVLNKGYMVQLPAVSTDGSESMTLREVLGYVGAMYGGNWIITDEGKLRLVPLKPSGTAIDLGTSGIDLQTFPAYDAIGTVHLVVSEEQEYVAGTTGRSIEIQCPWGTQAMANALRTALFGYAYQPITITTEYEADPLFELGDTITFNNVTSVIADVTNNFSLAYTADISAPNGQELEHEYPFVDKAQQEIKRTVAKATASLRVDVDAIIAQVTDADGNYTALTLKSDGLHIGNDESTVKIDGRSIVAGTVVAGSVSASNIEAGTISANGESGAINFNGNFNYYFGNRLAGSLGVMVAEQDLAIMRLGGPPGGATSKTPTITLAQMGVGYSDSSITQISSHTIRLYGGVTIGDMTDPDVVQFTVHNYNELPNPHDYANGTIGIVIL